MTYSRCQGICHVSHVSTYDDPEYMRGVCEHVIASINNSGTVNRVVVTSSIAAIISRPICRNWCDGRCFMKTGAILMRKPKRITERGQGYSMGKVELEWLFTTPPRHMVAGTAFAFVQQITLARSFQHIKKTWGLGNTILK